MKINSVLGGYADAASGGRRVEAGDAIAARKIETALAGAPRAAAGEAVRQIMAENDLTRISPQRFSAMLEQLRQADVLSDEEFSQLAQIRVELDAEGEPADEPIDLVAWCRERVRQLFRQMESADKTELPGLGQALDMAQRRLGWLEKLALVHEAPESVGLDAFA